MQSHKMLINICLVRPAGYIHSSGLLDAARYFKYQFERLGHDVKLSSNHLDRDSINLVFGAHLGFDRALLADYACVIVNLEQFGYGGASLSAAYLDLLKRAPVIDYDATHPAAYGVDPEDVPIVSFGYAPYLQSAACSPTDLQTRPIDLLFFGSMNRRRREILDRIESTGRRIHIPNRPTYGEERDLLVRQAKGVVNIHFYESAHFEQVRAFQVLSMGTPLISERTAATKAPEAYDICSLWFDDSGLEPFFKHEFLGPSYLEFGAKAIDVFRTADPIRDYENALAFMRGVFQVYAARRKPVQAGTGRLVGQDAQREASREVRSESQCSIIIPVFNKVEFTRQCVEAIRKSTDEALYELIFIDNASSDETQEFLSRLGGRVTVIRNEENLGFVDACNQGARVATGRYLVFLNNDTVPLPNWLEGLLSAFEADRAVGAAGVRLVYPDGRLQEAGGIIFSDGSGWNFGRFSNPFDPAFQQAMEVDYCSGATLMVRRDLFEKLGGFDRRYCPAYYEDTDLCFGIRSLGYKVVYTPAATVAHFEGVTAGTDISSGFKRYQVINQEKFREKWAEALSMQDLPPSITRCAPTTADRARLSRRPFDPKVPHVLIIDPHLPLHDRASGSLRLFRIVQSLRRQGCQVTFIARNGIGQDAYKKQLEAMGVLVFSTDPEKMAALGYRCNAPRIDLKRLLEERPCDIAWLSFYDVAEQYIDEIRMYAPRATVIVDTVDVHFLRERRQAELSRDTAGMSKADRTRLRELSVYARADAVITVTDADAETLRDAGLEVPTITLTNLHPAVGMTPAWRERVDLIFVGNFNHPPNIDGVKWLVAEIMPFIWKQLPDVKLNVVGTNPPAEIKSLANDKIIVHGWVPDTSPYLDSSRVSVAPLRVGAGMKGKVGEALSRGLPVVATTIGVEGMHFHDGSHVFVADEPRAFANAVVRLYQEEDTWQRMAIAGREHVDSRFSPAAAAATLQKIVSHAVAARLASCEQCA